MYFTTQALYKRLLDEKKLPDSVADPFKIKEQKFRYMKLYEEVNVSEPFNNLRFINFYTQMMQAKAQYETSKAVKNLITRKIEFLLNDYDPKTSAQAHVDKKQALELRIK
mmetsp:Transcript_41790/g.63830  ORF Transcript_41790/g.63830 Transcript_41790/m.63830 type:complete len:110 (-) Transcript_41790:732-1061(-)